MTRKTTEKHVPHEAEEQAVVAHDHEVQPDDKAEAVPAEEKPAPAKPGKTRKVPAKVDEVVETAPAYVLLPEGVQELRTGSLLVVCAQPGFKRAGIEHPRLKVYRDGELTPAQIGQMRREPKLTLVEVG